MDVSARVLFDSNRTCCVCRDPTKAVQIHHLDEDPSNHSLRNLAVLCFDCHRETQIRGGFDRKLDSEQIILYRDDWTRSVTASRTRDDAPAEAPDPIAGPTDAALATSIVEILRDRDDVENLAFHYHRIGNDELRDKYVDEVLSRDPDPHTLVRWRRLQGRLDEVPDDAIEEHLAFLESIDLTAYASFLFTLGRFEESARVYARVITQAIDDNRPFSAAFYLRRMTDIGLAEHLYICALAQAVDRDDLWWEMRALQELNWDSELASFFEKNADRIEECNDETLRALLAEAQGRDMDALEHRKEAVRRGAQPYIWLEAAEDGEDEQADSAETSE
jgi:hypothetical protein